MGCFGLNDGAQLAFHRSHRESLQHVFRSDVQEWASEFVRPGVHDPLGPMLGPNVIQRTWLARERAN